MIRTGQGVAKRSYQPDARCSSCGTKAAPLGWWKHGWECESCFRYWNPEICGDQE